MLVVTRFFVTEETRPGFAERAEAVLAALSARPGFRSGQLGRAADDPRWWVLTTAWANAGSYRRAMSDAQVRIAAMPLLAAAQDEPSVYELLVEQLPGEAALRRDADGFPDGAVGERSSRRGDPVGGDHR